MRRWLCRCVCMRCDRSLRAGRHHHCIFTSRAPSWTRSAVLVRGQLLLWNPYALICLGKPSKRAQPSLKTPYQLFGCQTLLLIVVPVVRWFFGWGEENIIAGNLFYQINLKGFVQKELFQKMRENILCRLFRKQHTITIREFVWSCAGMYVMLLETTKGLRWGARSV